ncbi:MAG TPA: hypothetical protein VGN63_15555 [Flavisolibacter sp.]|jgi:hypothetical protein|nr:hypothetical protein [Flavisolibacter sp.]
MENPTQENRNSEQEQPFQSDTEKLAQRHLKDPDHVITDEEMQNIRVGMTPPPDAPTEEAIRDAKEKAADHKADNDGDTTPGAQKITPWDVIGP